MSAKDGDKKDIGVPYGAEPDGEHEDGTRVDLGDDLLNERTVMLTRASSHPAITAPTPGRGGISGGAPPAETPFDPVDQLESAQILIGEGLFEEAKRILRKILLVNHENVQARQKLTEIHELELRQIFNEQRPNRFRARREKREEDLSVADPDEVLRLLDRDLRLQALEEGESFGMPRSAITVFGDAASIHHFADKLDRDLQDYGAKDRMDIGIAFMELGLAEVALRQFDAALEACHRANEPDVGLVLASVSLKAYTLISQSRPYDAISVLDPYLSDPEIDDSDKLDLIYLMGRSQEMAGMKLEARQWYLQVKELDPDYRDVKERLKAGKR